MTAAVAEHERLHTRLRDAIDRGANQEQSGKNLPFGDRMSHHVVGRWVDDGEARGVLGGPWGGDRQHQCEPSKNAAAAAMISGLVALVLEEHDVVITNLGAFKSMISRDRDRDRSRCRSTW